MDHAPQTQSYYIDPRSYAPSKPYETPKLLDPFSGDDPPQNKGAGKTNEKGMKKGRKDHPKGRKGGLTKTGAATGATGRSRAATETTGAVRDRAQRPRC